MAKRFQEPISLEQWASGQLISPLVDLSAIDRIPVTMIHPIDDAECPTEFAEYIYSQLSSEKEFSVMRGDHYAPFYGTDGLVGKVLDILGKDTATTEPAEDVFEADNSGLLRKGIEKLQTTLKY